MAIWDWFKVAGSNTTVEGISAAEGMQPGVLNDLIRAIVAGIAAFRDDTGGQLTAGGTANTLTLTPNGTITAYAAGQKFEFIALLSNLGAATLNVDNNGAKDIRKVLSTGTDVALGADDIRIGGHYVVSYDTASGGRFILHNPSMPERTTLARTDAATTFTADLTVSGGSPILKFDETDQTGTAGLFAILGRDGELRIRRNTAATRDFATFETPFIMAGDDVTFAAKVISGGNPNASATTDGVALTSDGKIRASADAEVPMELRRRGAVGRIAEFYRNATLVGSVEVAAASTTYNTTSDVRLKTAIVPLDADAALALVMKGEPVTFEYRSDRGKRLPGFIAQDMVRVCPAAVTPPVETGDMWMMDYGRPMPLVWAAVQALARRVEQLETNHPE